MKRSQLALAACLLAVGCNTTDKKYEIDDAWLEDKLVVQNVADLQSAWPQIEIPRDPRDRMMSPEQFRAMIKKAEEEARKACRMQVFGVDYLPPEEEITHLQLLDYFHCLKAAGLLGNN